MSTRVLTITSATGLSFVRKSERWRDQGVPRSDLPDSLSPRVLSALHSYLTSMPDEAECPIQTEQRGSSGGNNEHPVSRRASVDGTIVRECESSSVKVFLVSRGLLWAVYCEKKKKPSKGANDASLQIMFKSTHRTSELSQSKLKSTPMIETSIARVLRTLLTLVGAVGRWRRAGGPARAAT